LIYQFDQTTNKTPKKRTFEYPKSWRRTRGHDEIVSELRLARNPDASDNDDSDDNLTPGQEDEVLPILSPTQENGVARDLKKSLLPVATASTTAPKGTTGIPRPILGVKNS